MVGGVNHEDSENQGTAAPPLSRIFQRRLALNNMTFLVGRNGAGKSTLMDALSFLSESMTDSIGTALERRGNLEGLRQRQPGKGNRFDVSVAVVLEPRTWADLSLWIQVGDRAVPRKLPGEEGSLARVGE